MNRLEDAIANSIATRNIELLALDGEVFKTFVIDYDDGPRFLEIVRNEDATDWLTPIYSPKVAVEP